MLSSLLTALVRVSWPLYSIAGDGALAASYPWLRNVVGHLPLLAPPSVEMRSLGSTGIHVHMTSFGDFEADSVEALTWYRRAAEQGLGCVFPFRMKATGELVRLCDGECEYSRGLLNQSHSVRKGSSER